MDEYIRKSDAIEQALAQIHLLDITVRERILNFDGKAQAKTNADRIRSMSDEELAERLALYMKCDFCPMQGQHLTVSLSQCEKILLSWLKEEVTE